MLFQADFSRDPLSWCAPSLLVEIIGCQREGEGNCIKFRINIDEFYLDSLKSFSAEREKEGFAGIGR